MIGYKDRISTFLTKEQVGTTIEIYGWVRTFRNNQFLSVNDGSALQSLQVVLKPDQFPEELTKKLNTGAAVRAKGTLAESQGKGQETELLSWRNV